MRVVIINYPVNNIKSFFEILKEDYIIAVDRAFDICDKEGIVPDVIVGDFDSIKSEKKTLGYLKVKYDSYKNETDSFLALLEAKKNNPDEIVILGGIGGKRIEHFLANLSLLDAFDNIRIIDNNSEISLIKEGIHCLIGSKYKYISFFAVENSVITLEGFKFPLKNYNLKILDPLCISNEIIDNGIVNIKSGKVLVIKSLDDA